MEEVSHIAKVRGVIQQYLWVRGGIEAPLLIHKHSMPTTIPVKVFHPFSLSTPESVLLVGPSPFPFQLIQLSASTTRNCASHLKPSLELHERHPSPVAWISPPPTGASLTRVSRWLQTICRATGFGTVFF